jgi:predicted DsbA family dithiol-disulfide isomerase
MATPVRIDVVSDVICPWCFIGKRRLEKALGQLNGEIDTRITWLPFQLNPEMPIEGVVRAQYREQKFGSLERSRALDARVSAEFIINRKYGVSGAQPPEAIVQAIRQAVTA